ncbi:hypothetical protein Cylst_5823 [Cylindrospermum stagnale PCC 7417]|uniref:Uncharacterized protein n=1 Tax=Cylindrospermum stagnale PCC 7417 TaxID=56107 RepID=K9X5P6_9NOST|nr:hypothetical protein [Cylindrospermum stagnale]AFZ27808.1 hypothetical protein Cylst_5823 [Cylindrospermum stagnale PCC 7417]
MQLENLWREDESKFWLPILSLPTLHWAKPFLSILELPNALIENLDVWIAIYERAVIEYKTRLQKRNSTINIHQEESEIVPLVVTNALFDLAQQLGQDVAIKFEQWVRWQFFSEEVSSALEIWELILRYVCRRANFHSNRISPPAALVPILPDIANLVSSERRHEIESVLEHTVSPSNYENLQDAEMLEFDEVTLFSRAIDQAWTLRALQIIAEKLNDQERSEVVTWALSQAVAMKLKNAQDKICGDKYLKVEPLCFNVPSVFDFPQPNNPASSGNCTSYPNHFCT